MILAAGAVTIYFIGLVHFHHPAGVASREVIVPRVVGDAAIPPHRADVAISGLEGGETACGTLGGTWTTPICKVSGISGQRISLPPSSPAELEVKPSFNAIPNLATLCPSVGAIHPDVLTDSAKYAARLTITSGKLAACTNRQEWISYLITDAGTFSIGSASVTLHDGATVWITNNPAADAASARAITHDPDSHFGWYYKLYDGTASCTTPPTAPKSGSVRCPGDFARIDSGTSGTVGCSNSTCCTH